MGKKVYPTLISFFGEDLESDIISSEVACKTQKDFEDYEVGRKEL